MLHKQKQQTQKENRLIFKDIEPSALLHGIEEPLRADQGIVNPESSVSKFLAAEHDASGNAFDKPVMSTVHETKDDIASLVKTLASVPQTAVKMVTTPLGMGIEKTAEVAGKVITTPVKLAVRVPMATVGAAANLGGLVANIAKLGVSAVNVGISKLIRNPLFYRFSKFAKSVKRYLTDRTEKFDEAINTASNSLRSSLDKVKIPGLPSVDPIPKAA